VKQNNTCTRVTEKHTQKNLPSDKDKTTKHGLFAFYNILSGNWAGLFSLLPSLVRVILWRLIHPHVMVCCVWNRLDDAAGQLNVDLVAAITNAVCPTADCSQRTDTSSQWHGKLPISIDGSPSKII